jgi:hypothetical protein
MRFPFPFVPLARRDAIFGVAYAASTAMLTEIRNRSRSVNRMTNSLKGIKGCAPYATAQKRVKLTQPDAGLTLFGSRSQRANAASIALRVLTASLVAS